MMVMSFTIKSFNLHLCTPITLHMKARQGIRELTHLPLDKMAAIVAEDIFKCISMNEKFFILFRISLKYVPKGSIE